MDDTARRRPLIAAATLTTAGALALTPITVTPHAPSISPARISTQAVQLTDAWTDLFTDTVTSAVGLATSFLGKNNNLPLPSPTIFVAPIATQLVLNQFIYAAQLLTGKGGLIPGEISAHLTAVVDILGQVLGSAGPLLGEYLKVPFAAAQAAFDYVATATNPLIALVEAPAVFLNLALNNQYGLLGQVGPIGFPIIIRNVLATALYTTPPTIVLPFKKAASTPKPAATTTATVKVAAPSGTAGSARSKPKAPSSAANKRKAASVKADNNSAGQGHSKRG